MKIAVPHLALALIALFAVAPSLSASAQDYPNRPVRIFLGYPPGGGIDIQGRRVAAKISEILGQQFIMENKPGAGGLLAATQVAQAPADGYTLLLGETSLLEVAPNVTKNLPYDPEKDLTPIALLTTAAFVLVSSPKASLATLQDVVTIGRLSPGKLTYGSSGSGSIHHLMMEAFARPIGLNMTQVPYRGGGQLVAAIMSSEVDLILSSMTAVQEQIADGKLKLLATTSKMRLPAHPKTPSLSTLVPEYDYAVEIGLLGPVGLPPAVVAKLSPAIKSALESPEFLRVIQATPGAAVTWMSPEQYKQHIASNGKRYGDVVKLIGFTPE